jgi:hypothetical protein
VAALMVGEFGEGLSVGALAVAIRRFILEQGGDLEPVEAVAVARYLLCAPDRTMVPEHCLLAWTPCWDCQSRIRQEYFDEVDRQVRDDIL